jgi:hypothetical protein
MPPSGEESRARAGRPRGVVRAEHGLNAQDIGHARPVPGSATRALSRGRDGPVKAPLRARMWLPSTTAADQPIAPAELSRSSSVWCRRSQTPAACQSRSRRHAVTPEQPSSCGTNRHAIPVTSTKTIALNATRVRHPRAARRRRLHVWQQRLDGLPYLVADLEDSRHQAPSRHRVMSTLPVFATPIPTPPRTCPTS